MEEVIDFDQWYLNHKIVIEYWAVYNPETGKVQGIYPNDSANEFEYKIKIDNDIAESIGNGKVSLANCYVDLESDKLEITEVKLLLKIDDLLHRVIDKQWSDIVDPDLIITARQNNLEFKLSDTAKGKKRIHYNGDTIMDFYITEYNDPNILLEKLTLKIDDLTKKDHHIFNLELPDKFSIYTRRIFKKYILINEIN